MKKKLLGILLTAVLVVCAFTICTSAATTISDAAGLMELMNTSSMWSGDYVLGGNIDLSEYEGDLTQSPIGNSNTRFTGTFDGAGYTISGINITGSTQALGLFGLVEGDAVTGDAENVAPQIKDLTVKGTVESSSSRAGGIVGDVYGGDVKILNCTSYVTVTASAGASGGIVGTYGARYASRLTIENCINYGYVTGKCYMGGMIGYILNSSGSFSYTTTVKGCENHGNIKSDTSTGTGGMVGYLYQTVTSKSGNSFTIENCANYGDVSSNTNYAGGMVGIHLSTNNYYGTTNITNCYNEGTITAASYAAGIIGIARPWKIGEFNITDVYTTDYPIIGLFGVGNSSTNKGIFNITYAYTVNGTAIYEKSSANDSITETACYTSESTYLAGLTGDNWTTIDNAPFLKVGGHPNYSEGYITTNTQHHLKCCCGEVSAAEDHVDEVDDDICDVCGYDMACSHEGGTTEEVAEASTCKVNGILNKICNDCGAITESTSIDLNATNHADNTNWVWIVNAESGVYEILCSECGEIYCSQTSLPTVHLSNFDGIEGDDTANGLTSYTAVKTLNEAVERIKNVGGTVAITKGYTLGADHTLPEWGDDVTITFSSNTFDSNGAATAGFNITTHNVELILGGKAKFDKILFKGTSKKNATYTSGTTTKKYTADKHRAIISANWHDVDFGYIRAQQYATIYLVAGYYGIKESDIERKTTNITVDGPALSDKALPYFFERIYLGSVFSAGNIEVSNKTVTLEVEDGYKNSKATQRSLEALIYTIYTMSTTATNAYGSSTTNGCISTVTLNDNSGVVNFRTGDRNVSYDLLTNGEDAGTESYEEYGPSGGKLDRLIVNLNYNSQIADVKANTALAVEAKAGTFQVKNAVNTTINVSSYKADERTEKLIHSFYFYKYGTFKETEATVTVNGGSHSFTPSITDYVREDARTTGGDAYTVVKDVTDECTWDAGKVTAAATASADGEITYTCTECGRVREEALPYTSFAKFTAVAGEIVDGKVTVDISIDAGAIAGAVFTVAVPEGFTYESAADAEDSFYLDNTDTRFVLINLNDGAANVALDNAVIATVTYKVDETVFNTSGEIAITVKEAYDTDENALATLTVNGTVTHKHVCAEPVLVADTVKKAAYYACTCDTCGGAYEEAAVAEALEAAYGSTVILESDLGLQIVVNTAKEVTDASKIWLIVESTDAYGNVTKAVVNPYHAYATDANGTKFVYRFNAARVAAKNVGDTVSVTFCMNIDNTKYAAAKTDCNIITYYKVAKGAGAPNAVMNVLNAMMTYGAAAQKYFAAEEGKDITDAELVTTLAGATEVDYADVAIEAETTETTGGGYAYKAPKVSAKLKDKVVMVINYTGTYEGKLVFKGSYTDINNKLKTISVDATVNADSIEVEIDSIAAKDLRQKFNGALYSVDENNVYTQVSETITTCFEAYAKAAIEQYADKTLLHAVCRAALAYSDAAKAYFVSK